MWNQPRTINMSAIGRALLEEQNPPVKALYVYNSNPVAIAPDSQQVIAGFSRSDLFTVVHEIFQTDTADYADILLPATTQLEHFDLHKYGPLPAPTIRQSRRWAKRYQTAKSFAGC
jgi:anaerobic selenocysteine-containing dehydrogenase